MSLRVNLKLKLSKVKKVVVVKYNTFEKATFDEYIMASLALHAKNQKEAEKYIDEITGSGSLNPHFKELYHNALEFGEEQLQKIMESSFYPILKIDKENWYYYYPQLDISEYKNKLYNGDLGELSNVIDIIKLGHVDLVEKSTDILFTNDKAEPFDVLLDTNSVKLVLKGQQIDITEELFNEIRVNELTTLGKFRGIVFNDVAGSNWRILTDLVIDNIANNQLGFYDEGKYWFIQNDGCKVTTVAQTSGLCIYKEDVVKYVSDKKLCEKVGNYLIQKGLIGHVKESIVLNILKNVDDDLAQRIININLDRSDSIEIAQHGLQLLASGFINGWSTYAQQCFLKYATGIALQNLYFANPNLIYTIDQLLVLDRTKLSFAHRQQITNYYEDLNAKKTTIREITGLVTTSGLRERVKAISADADTKKFSRLCNELIGHVNKDLEKATMRETSEWLTQAIELKRLMNIIEQKLQK